MLGNTVKTNGAVITASSATTNLTGQLSASTVDGIAQFTTLNMSMPGRGNQVIQLSSSGIQGVTISVGITAGRPYKVTMSISSTTAICDSLIPVPPLNVRVFDSGNGELSTYTATQFFLQSTTTMTSNSVITTAAPFIFSSGVVVGSNGLASFTYSLESNRTIAGPSTTVYVIPGAPRSMSISNTVVSVDIAGPTIALPTINFNVRDFCGNVPNTTTSSTLTIRPLNSTISFLGGVTALTQDASGGSAVLNMQFTTPLPGTYFLNFEMAGVSPSAVLQVNVIAGNQFRLSAPITVSTGVYHAIPLRTIDQFAFRVLDVQGNPSPASKISITYSLATY